MKKALMIGCGIVAVIALVWVVGCTIFAAKVVGEASKQIEADKKKAAERLATPPGASAPAKTGNWEYQTEEDALRGGASYFASTYTTEPLGLGFPYEKTRGLITVRISTQYGKDAIVGLTNGVIVCHNGCMVPLRFDDGPVEKWAFKPAANGNSDVLFAVNDEKFTDRLLASKQVIAEVQLYDRGAQQLKFTTAGLTWPPPAATQAKSAPVSSP